MGRYMTKIKQLWQMNISVIVLFIIISVTSSLAQAKGSSYDTEDNDVNNTGIVTPNIATNGIRIEHIGIAPDGGILVCPIHLGAVYGHGTAFVSEKCIRSANDTTSGWVYLKNAIPNGRTYAGFRIVSGYQGVVYYEVYWK